MQTEINNIYSLNIILGDLSTSETTEIELNNDDDKENRRKRTRNDASNDRLSQKRRCRQVRFTLFIDKFSLLKTVIIFKIR